MCSLRPSARGLEIVDRARQRRGWTKTRTVAWWQSALTSQATLRRFWRRLPIQQESFIRICEVVGVSNWEEIADHTTLQEPEAPALPLQDWGEAPDVCGFYGRTEELTTLDKWIVTENCRLVALLGMGGIGKTALAATLADGIQDKFESIIWRCLTTSRYASTLRHAPPVQEFLTDLIRFLFKQETDVPDSLDARVSKLMSYLHQHRCLLVLDNFETVLRSGNLAGYYCEGYEGYGELIRRVGEERHQSCLLLTTREKPKEIAIREGKTLPVRSLSLTGLQETDAREILREKGLSDQDNWRRLIQIYRTNPLVLKIVAAAIKESFDGRVREFLKQNTLYLGQISDILDQQFDRLIELEKEIMHRIALNGKPLSLDDLRCHLASQLPASNLISALTSLGQRSLIEKIPEESEILYTLQPVVMKYVNNRLSIATY